MGAFASRVQALFAPIQPPSPADLVTSHFCAPATLAAVRAAFFAWHFTILLCLIIPPNRLALPQFCYLTIQSYSLIILYCLLGAVQYWRHRHVLDAIASGAGRPLQPVETSGRYPPPVHPSLRAAHYSFPSFSQDSPTLPSVVAIETPATPMQLPPSMMAGTAASTSSSSQEPSNMAKLDWIDNVHWVLFEILSTVAPFVTLVYWTLIYPKATNVRWWADTHVHALNSFVMLSDLFLNRMWHAPRHLAWVVGFGVYYAVFGVWAHWQYNEWAYAFLDPTKNHYWALTYIGISILFSLFFVFANYLVRVRNSFAGSQRLSLQHATDGTYSHLSDSHAAEQA